MTVEERRGLALVAIAVLFFSTSPVLIRWAALSVSSFEIAAGRLLVAGIAVSGTVLLRNRVAVRTPAGRGPIWSLLAARSDWPRFALFGLVAALHFFFYAYSLEFTTIAHSLAIMYTAPIWVALLSRLVLGEPLSMRKWLGIVVAVLGVAFLAGFEPIQALIQRSGSATYNFTRRMLIGDLLALGSAITFAVYSIGGRSQRERYPLLVYVGWVYILAALWLLPVAGCCPYTRQLQLARRRQHRRLGRVPTGVRPYPLQRGPAAGQRDLCESHRHAGGVGRRAVGRAPAAGDPLSQQYHRRACHHRRHPDCALIGLPRSSVGRGYPGSRCERKGMWDAPRPSRALS